MDLVAHYAAVKKRILSSASLPERVSIEKKQKFIEEINQKKEELRQDRIRQVQRRMPDLTPELRSSITHILLAHNLTWEQITGTGKIRPYVMCRRSIVWLLHCQGWSSPRIGRLMKRDHSTVLHALNEVNWHGRLNKT